MMNYGYDIKWQLSTILEVINVYAVSISFDSNEFNKTKSIMLLEEARGWQGTC
jgi:hypothetical protein